MKQRTFFRIAIHIEELASYAPRPNNILSDSYLCELDIQDENPKNIYLKIFYKQSEYAGEKLMRWVHDNNVNVLTRFEVLKIESPKRLINIEFSDYYENGIQESTSYFEFDSKYIIIKLTGIRLVYKDNNTDTSNEVNRSEFYLNKTSFKLIEQNYYYDYPWLSAEKKYEWKPINRIKEFINFGSLSFLPEHNFYHHNCDDETVLIKKEPRFRIEHINLTFEEINHHVILLCALYSFYCNETIEFTFSKVFLENKIITDTKLGKEGRPLESIHGGLFKWEFFTNPLNLIINVDSNHLLAHLNFTLKIIERFNYALLSSNESKFMVLYNILEEIRNHYVINGIIDTDEKGNPGNIKKVQEEYLFLDGKKTTDNKIREILSQISGLIHESQRDLFNSEIQYKLTPIKVMSMTNQFNSFFNYLEISPSDYGLNYTELKSLRDQIFHGRPVSNISFLSEINKNLPKFTGSIILKYMGVKDLKNIKTIKED